MEIVNRNIPIVSAPLSEVSSPECREITVSATSDEVKATFEGLTGPGDKARTGSTEDKDEMDLGDQRPR